MTTNKAWGGRFDKAPDRTAASFGASVGFDHVLWPYDIEGSIAHATMLGETGVIPADDARVLVDGLRAVAADLSDGRGEWSVEDEDVHMNVERMLREKVGPVAGKLHTARSRNDQVALDLHLYVKERCRRVVGLTCDLRESLLSAAAASPDAVLPAYTHLQRAQPVLLAHHLLAYCAMLGRDARRFRLAHEGADVCPLGAGAVAGTTFPIDRRRTAELLGFGSVYGNSMDAVSDRDFVLDFLSASAVLMTHLSRLSEEIVLWCSQEFGFAEPDDAFATGSSMMPQKKNPDPAELVRGKTGRVYGSLVALLTVMKGLPLAYNKDMQEDKEGLFDAADTVCGSLGVLAGMVRGLTFDTSRMRQAAEGGFCNATDLADYLVRRGVPFREAHEVTGRVVRDCLRDGRTLGELSAEEYAAYSPRFDGSVSDAVDLRTVVGARRSEGGTAPERVEAQMNAARHDTAADREWADRSGPGGSGPGRAGLTATPDPPRAPTSSGTE